MHLQRCSRVNATVVSTIGNIVYGLTCDTANVAITTISVACTSRESLEVDCCVVYTTTNICLSILRATYDTANLVANSLHLGSDSCSSVVNAILDVSLCLTYDTAHIDVSIPVFSVALRNLCAILSDNLTIVCTMRNRTVSVRDITYDTCYVKGLLISCVVCCNSDVTVVGTLLNATYNCTAYETANIATCSPCTNNTDISVVVAVYEVTTVVVYEWTKVAVLANCVVCGQSTRCIYGQVLNHRTTARVCEQWTRSHPILDSVVVTLEVAVPVVSCRACQDVQLRTLSESATDSLPSSVGLIIEYDILGDVYYKGVNVEIFSLVVILCKSDQLSSRLNLNANLCAGWNELENRHSQNLALLKSCSSRLNIHIVTSLVDDTNRETGSILLCRNYDEYVSSSLSREELTYRCRDNLVSFSSRCRCKLYSRVVDSELARYLLTVVTTELNLVNLVTIVSLYALELQANYSCEVLQYHWLALNSYNSHWCGIRCE